MSEQLDQRLARFQLQIAQEGLVLPSGDYYQTTFINNWTFNDYTLEFFLNLSSAERNMVVNLGLLLNAVTPEALAERIMAQTLQLTRVPVELKDDPVLGRRDLHFANSQQQDAEIDLAKKGKSERLAVLNLDAIQGAEGNLVHPKLAELLTKFNNLLKEFGLDGILRLSSALRNLQLQALFKKLGYPAVEVSFHTLGMAADFALAIEPWAGREDAYFHEFNAGFGIFDKTGIAFTQEGIHRLNEILIANPDTIVSIDLLSERGLLSPTHLVLQVYSLMKSLQSEGLLVIDESNFFSRGLNIEYFTNPLGETVGVVTFDMKPVFHLQLRPELAAEILGGEK
jgi:hypothetical protein